MNTPTQALTIRQPWAWLIVHAGKDIENRTWRTNYRGPVLIHAAKGMTRREYLEALAFIEQHRDFNHIIVPDFEALQRGGIIGQAVITGCVGHSHSPWWMGPYGFTLADAKPLPFTPCAGRLGFFTPTLPTKE